MDAPACVAALSQLFDDRMRDGASGAADGVARVRQQRVVDAAALFDISIYPQPLPQPQSRSQSGSQPQAPSSPPSLPPSLPPDATNALHVVCCSRSELAARGMELLFETLPRHAVALPVPQPPSLPPLLPAVAAGGDAPSQPGGDAAATGTAGAAVDAGAATSALDAMVRKYAAHGGAGFYMQPTPDAAPAIVVVAEANADVAALTRLLAHELTHAVDARVHGVDITVAGYLACTEVRAAAAAECAAVWPRFLARRCQRDHALRSTELVFPAHAAVVVDAVLPDCSSLPLRASPLSAAIFRHVPRPTSPPPAAVAAAAALAGRSPLR